MRHALSVEAIPLRLKFSEEKGYRLISKIVKGPANLLDRIVTVKFSGAQLDQIGEADFSVCTTLELESIKNDHS